MSQAKIFFDAHVHLYPQFELDVLLTAFASHADIFARDADVLAMAVMLRGFQPTLDAVFEPFKERNLRGWTIEESEEKCYLATDGRHRIFMLPARQVAAKERIEALGYFGEADVPDGLSLEETVGRLGDAGYQPVIAWGLGKWLFKRGPVVASALESAGKAGKPLPVCDCALRPTFWPTPQLYKRAVELGGFVLYGSDPLPRIGDEYSAGSYAMLLEAPFDETTPATSMLSAIRTSALTPVGKRYGLAGTLRRLH